MSGYKEYSSTKYKSVSPMETVSRIKGILEEHNIRTSEKWTESGVDTICSVRVTIEGTNIGQNGKGTSREFAMASGYAEFIERLQTGYLLPERFFRMKDSVYVDISEAEKMGGELLCESLRAIRKKDTQFDFMPVDTAYYLNKWSYDSVDGKISVLPYLCEKTQKILYLPENIDRAYYYTNGSCAGNTKEEAMVQGLSEICERYATDLIMSQKYTLPVVPKEEYENIPGLADMVKTISDNKRYTLRIMDASCNLGLPVLVVALFDRQKGKVILRFGAHPKFEVALERCITEILQGRTIDNLENSVSFDSRFENAGDNIVNKFNFMKGAFGYFPTSIYADNPSWEYSKWPDAPDEISKQYSFMKELYEGLGWDIYVRDCSYMGFPTYHIIVPGISMVFNFGMERLVEKSRAYAIREVVKNPITASEIELTDYYNQALLKRGFILENTYAFLSGVPVYPQLFGKDIDASIVAALLACYFKDKDTAASLLKLYCYDKEGNITQFFPLYQLLRSNSLSETEAILKCFCPESWIMAAKTVLNNPLGALPNINCPDCEECKEADKCELKKCMPKE